MAHTISFQYMERDDEGPRAGYELTDAEFEIPSGATVPRVGEFIDYITAEGGNQFVVLAVQTRIFVVDGQDPGWHSYVTLGPAADVADQRLLIIRE